MDDDRVDYFLKLVEYIEILQQTSSQLVDKKSREKSNRLNSCNLVMYKMKSNE